MRARRRGAWPAAASPSSSRSPRPGRGSPSRSASPSWARRRSSCAATNCSSRAASRSATPARVLSRYVDAIVIRSGSHEAVAELAADGRGAGRQRADPAPPPLPGARRPAHPARALRRPRTACASPTSATATTSPARWRSPASSPGSSVTVAAPAGLPARGGPRREADRRPARRRRRRRRDLHRRLGQHGRRGRGRAPPRRPGAVPGRRRPARRGQGRRRRPALPARPPRRGDHRRGPLRRRAPPSGTRPRTACTRRRRCCARCSAE